METVIANTLYLLRGKTTEELDAVSFTADGILVYHLANQLEFLNRLGILFPCIVATGIFIERLLCQKWK